MNPSLSWNVIRVLFFRCFLSFLLRIWWDALDHVLPWLEKIFRRVKWIIWNANVKSFYVNSMKSPASLVVWWLLSYAKKYPFWSNYVAGPGPPKDSWGREDVDRSGQIMATSHDLTPNGGLGREVPGNFKAIWRLVKYYNLARSMGWSMVFLGALVGLNIQHDEVRVGWCSVVMFWLCLKNLRIVEVVPF